MGKIPFVDYVPVIPLFDWLESLMPERTTETFVIAIVVLVVVLPLWLLFVNRWANMTPEERMLLRDKK